jgi:hypothetical protein
MVLQPECARMRRLRAPDDHQPGWRNVPLRHKPTERLQRRSRRRAGLRHLVPVGDGGEIPVFGTPGADDLQPSATSRAAKSVQGDSVDNGKHCGVGIRPRGQDLIASEDE